MINASAVSEVKRCAVYCLTEHAHFSPSDAGVVHTGVYRGRDVRAREWFDDTDEDGASDFDEGPACAVVMVTRDTYTNRAKWQRTRERSAVDSGLR